MISFFGVSLSSTILNVAELPSTAYLWGRQHGKAWTAIPVFPAWVFSTHTETLVNVDAGVQSPRIDRAANQDSPLPGDRSHIPIHELAQHPRIKWLFPDRKAAAIEYHKKIGYLQPIHCIIVKQEIVERHAVNIIPAGGSATRLSAMDARGLDATVVSYDHAIIAAQKGMTILGDLADIVAEFPDRLIVVRRSFLDKERDVMKHFLQALSESIHQVRTQREKIVPIITKHLKGDRKVAEETYDTYHNVFSFPPRVGRKGIRSVVDIVLQQMGRPKGRGQFEPAD